MIRAGTIPWCIVFPIAAILLGKTASAQAASKVFPGPTSHVVGLEATAPAVADVNGDGYPDVAVVSQVTNSVSVALGKGGFAFEEPMIFSTGAFVKGVSWPFPSDVAIADFDGDGRPDLAVANAYMGAIAILLQDSGSFSLIDNYIVGGSENSAPFWVAAGDLNGDGLADVVAACVLAESVSVLLAQGDGVFVPSMEVPLSNPGSIQVADVDRDDRLDVVVTSFQPTNTVSVLLGTGDGHLSAPVGYDAGPNPRSVELADLDGDEHLDILVANPDVDAISILRGHGDGTFAAAVSHPAGSEPDRVVAGDVDGDGALDVLVTSRSGNTLSVLLGHGDGNLDAPESVMVGALPSIAGTADLNLDGKLDVLVANQGAGTIAVLRGLGAGSFETPEYGPIEHWADDVAVGDMNSDGTLDFVVTSSGSHYVSVLLGQGGGSVGEVTAFPVDAHPGSIALGDLDGDASIDVAVTKPSAKSLLLLLNQGDGTLGMEVEIQLRSIPSAVAIGDLDADGHLDLVVTTYNASLPSRIGVLLGQGGGVFGPETLYPAGLPASGTAIRDLDGDGNLDLAVVGTGGASVLRGLGDGTFGATATHLIDGELHTTLSVDDLDGNGVPDLALGSPTTETIEFLFGVGDGDFVHAGSLELGGVVIHPVPVSGLATGDVTGDGFMDLAVAVDQLEQVIVYPGIGDGAFGSPTPYDLLGAASALLTDIDGDGRLDMVAGNGTARTVSFSFNTGLAPEGSWTDLGQGLAGVAGVPSLAGTGRLTAGSSGSLALGGAAPSSPAVLFVALTSTPVPFHCGTLVPMPYAWTVLLSTDAGGGISFAWDAWPPAVSGVDIHMQYAVMDAAAACGISLSNAVVAVVP